MIKLKPLLLESGAVKFNPSFDRKVENAVDEYLSNTYELMYILTLRFHLLLTTSKAVTSTLIENELNTMRSSYPSNNKIKQLSSNQIKKYFKIFRSYGDWFGRGFADIDNTHHFYGILKVDKNDLPINYFKILNDTKLNVKLKIASGYDTDGTSTGSMGRYNQNFIDIFIINFLPKRHLISKYSNLKDEIVDVIKHEYIHHLQHISDMKFGVITKLHTGSDEYDSEKLQSTNDKNNYYDYLTSSKELKPIIQSYARIYQRRNLEFNPERLLNFLNTRLNSKLMQQKNPEQYKNFVSALYSELERRYSAM